MSAHAKRGVVAATLLTVVGVSGVALLGLVADREAGTASLVAQQDGYGPTTTAPPTTVPPTTAPPTTAPPTTVPPTTAPPTTAPPTTAPPSTPPMTVPPATPPNGSPELPVTGLRSLTIAGIGLVLVGLGVLIWALAGRRSSARA